MNLPFTLQDGAGGRVAQVSSCLRATIDYNVTSAALQFFVPYRTDPIRFTRA